VPVDPDIAHDCDSEQRQDNVEDSRRRHRRRHHRPLGALPRVRQHTSTRGITSAATSNRPAAAISASHSGAASDATRPPMRPTIAATSPLPANLPARPARPPLRASDRSLRGRREGRAATRCGDGCSGSCSAAIRNAAMTMVKARSLRTEPPDADVTGRGHQPRRAVPRGTSSRCETKSIPSQRSATHRTSV